MKLLLADDQVMFCEILAETLRLNAAKFYSLPVEVDFVHSLDGVASFLQAESEEDRPDFVFLDLDFGDGIHSGHVTIERYSAINIHGVKTIVLTASIPRERADITTFEKCTFLPFIRGILLKTRPMSWHYDGLVQIFRGGPFWSPDEVRIAIGASKHAGEGPMRAESWRLTKKEWAVANALCGTLKLEAIAMDLQYKSYDYFRSVCSAIYGKMGVPNRIGAIITIENARKANPDLGRL